jgi:kynureninase
MPALRAKSLLLTGYLEFLIDRINARQRRYTVITPREPAARGCQLSLLVERKSRALFDYLRANGVICDWREPNVIRLAPTPMYNSFEDVFRVGELLRKF